MDVLDKEVNLTHPQSLPCLITSSHLLL